MVVPRVFHGRLPRMCSSMPAPLSSSSTISAVNSGSPLTPNPSSLIGCGRNIAVRGGVRRKETFSPRAAGTSRSRRGWGSSAVQGQYFAVHSKRASSCLWILSVLPLVSKSCCSRCCPQLLPGPCSLLSCRFGVGCSLPPSLHPRSPLPWVCEGDGGSQVWAVPLAALGFPVTHPGIPAAKGRSGRGTVCGVGAQRSLMGCDSSGRACSCRLPSQGGQG